MAQVDRDLVFATHDGLELALDIYHAPLDDAPATVYVHGGGWRSGDKADDGPRRLAPLSAYGVTVASVNYRLAPGAVFPSQLHDVKAAVRWLRANGARLGLPTQRLGIWGASAGAYLGSPAGPDRRCRQARGDGGEPFAGDDRRVARRGAAHVAGSSQAGSLPGN